MRTVVFWAHLLTAVSAAAIVVIMAGTGVLLTYQRQIQAWADTRGLDGAPPSEGAVPLAPEVLVLRAEEGTRRATSIRWRRDPAAPVEVAFGRDSTVFLNGYTGAVLGDGSERAHAFFAAVTAWHRWLAQSDDGRASGRAVTGAANLAFLFIVVAGFYLWWPRRPSRRAFRNILVFRRGLSSKARDFNWHHVFGIWLFVPLVIVITSAIVISYAWAGGLVERLARERADQSAHAAPTASRPVPEELPAAAVRNPGPAQSLAATARASDGVAATDSAVAAAPDSAASAASRAAAPDAMDLLERARARMPDWNSVTMDLLPRSGTVVFALDRGSGGQPQRQARLVLSAETGEVVAWEPFSGQPRPARVRSLMRYTHTGEVFGIAGQTIAGIASAGAIVLAWTGLALALRRLRGWLRRRSPHRRTARREPAGGGPKQVV